MALILVSAPAAPSADTDALESLAAHLRTIEAAGSTEADEEVAPYLSAAVARLDGPSGLLGRALLDQTWRLELPSFPSSITLPLPPLQSVSSITYVDSDGDTQTLTASDYRVFGTDPAIILPPLNEDWPTDVQDDTPNAVKITFVAGYGDTLSDLPAQLWHAIMMDASHLYENREASLVGINASVLPLGYDTLVSSFRRWEF